MSTEGACGRPRSLWSLLSLALLLACSPVLARCPAPPQSEPVTVRHVIDGDTVVLGDGRHLRLVGLNAPERGRDGAADDHLAAAARDALQEYLARGPLTLTLAPEPRDRYRRLLGDLHDGRGRSVQELLVEAGLAWAVAVPPNTSQTGCLFEAESRARRAARGLWADPQRWLLDAATWPDQRRGFAVFEGTVSSRRELRRGTSLWLDGQVEVYIPDEAQAAFGPRLTALQPGQRITVRGWVTDRRGRPNLRLEHPANLAPVR